MFLKTTITCQYSRKIVKLHKDSKPKLLRSTSDSENEFGTLLCFYPTLQEKV